MIGEEMGYSPKPIVCIPSPHLHIPNTSLQLELCLKWRQWQSCPVNYCIKLYFCWCSLQSERLISKDLICFQNFSFVRGKLKFILKLVNFDIRMEFKNFYRYQNVNSLLVKCSEAGNVAAQFFLGR
ncbi:uncharacterized protein LOC141717749 [Apium graveolens]|uniref:uncharacterized protein LOC141717749 n=1 Tax=Apium graveolens TaxID=4045 RepID=UPI003D7BEEE3